MVPVQGSAGRCGMSARTTRRTALALGAAAASGAAIGAGPSVLTRSGDGLPAGAEHPDAELIAACEAYIAAFEASDASESDRIDDDPLFLAVCDAEQLAFSLEPKTLAGVVALARVAKHQAETASADHGMERWSTSYAGEWPARVCLALLRLAEAEAAGVPGSAT